MKPKPRFIGIGMTTMPMENNDYYAYGEHKEDFALIATHETQSDGEIEKGKGEPHRSMLGRW